MKYNLSRSIILNLTGKPQVFSAGLTLYQKEKVYITEGVGAQSIVSIVMEDQSYDVKLKFSKLGDLLTSKCSCHKTLKPCRHIVASLLQLMDDGDLLERVDTMELPWPFNDSTIYDQSKIKIKRADPTETAVVNERKFDQTQNKAEIKVIHSDFDGIIKRFRQKGSTSKAEIQLIPYLEFTATHHSNEYPVRMSFKIGSEYLYVIKDILHFMEAYNSGESLKFGSQFTLQSQEMKLSSEGQNLMDLLEQFHEEQKFYGIPVIKHSVVQLTHQNFIRILENCKLDYHDKKSNKKIKIRTQSDLFQFELIQNASHLECNILNHVDFKLLGHHINYVLVHREKPILIKTTIEQQTILNTLFPQKVVVPKIVFNRTQLQKYVDFILPNLEKIGVVEIHPELEKLFIQGELEFEVYLDYNGGAIQIEVLFRYGAVKINGLTEDNHQSDWIVGHRDYAKETAFMERFERYPYHRLGDHIKVLRDHEIFEFLKTEIVDLEQSATLYRTERFSRRRIITGDKIKQSIKTNESSNLLEYEIEIEGFEKEDALKLLRAYREKKKYYKLRNGDFLALEAGQFETIEELTHLFQTKMNKSTQIIDLPKASVYYLSQLMDEGRLALIDVPEDVLRLNHEKATEPLEIPEHLVNILRPYQSKGVYWLNQLTMYGFGGILADDMGLGKTLQMLTFIRIRKTLGFGRILIVAPTSLIYNWANEIVKFTDSLTYEIVEGAKENREKIIKSSDAHILITSYGVLRKDQELYGQCNFDMIVLDEAQHIKNEGSLTSKVVKQIPAKHKFALTGTPLENHLGELWSIFDFVMPSYLGTRYHFREEFEKKSESEEDQIQMHKLRHLIEPFMMRRIKKDVLKELPDKLETNLIVGMTDDQKKLYTAMVAEIKGEFLEDQAEKPLDADKRMRLLVGLMRLRQICAHPSAYLTNYEGGSGKLEALVELLSELEESGHRTLVFSQFTSVLKLIQKTIGTNCFYLDGGMPAKERMQTVERFNQGEKSVFLISLKAGGSGLNLTGADTVIHFDPWWNPAVEDQATDRAHRIGQEKRVHVIKLITQNSIEEKILALQGRKKALFDQIIQPGETFLNKLTIDEIKSLFTL
ncbi:DEAD/DEAH box helicase [Fusibacter sp. 3D3]|uniref:DEAD/DEAH box helicase n=1 Tax=Fusibacter sp. 3D3 TaxID=1048380 RepID=UPI0008533831|nr:DEAD/DEAH box helicase [Fusibacter sp. 3D3]GAU79365.1 superfamily II DNA-RNA helicases [Fusibacter sp. 3D3]